MGSQHQSLIASAIAANNKNTSVKQRGISISKSNREHKLNVADQSNHQNMNNVSGVYQSDVVVDDTRRTVASANNMGALNQYSAEFYYQYPLGQYG